MKKQFKSSASAARAFGGTSTAFGSSGGFATASSPLSYLNELPDLSSISDSSIVVDFKNLTKRDATTKTKALEDLQTLLSVDGKEIEDGVLDAWTNLYPRTSIDSARRVRQLAHTLQGQIAARSGKRIAKRMPGVVGAWLAGLYDSDKAVARAASDALAQIFATPEKRQALWKAYQDAILEYCRNIFDKESPQTLSDERSISKDEAGAKYHRVVTSAIGLLSSLVAELKEEDFRKNLSQYEELLQDKKLWEKATSEDVAVRRAVHKALRSFVQSSTAKPCLDFALLAKTYLSKGLDSDQTGSASDFVETVSVMTSIHLAVWTDSWQDKKPPSSRLKAFLKRGSQGSALNYWAAVVRMLRIIPRQALPSEIEKAAELMKALHNGVTRKDEPRAYMVEGYKAYVQIASLLAQALSEADQSTFLRDAVLPIVAQYLVPVADNTKWTMPPSAAQAMIQELGSSTALSDIVVAELPSMTRSDVVRQIKLSLPEQASDYTKSQDELSKVGQRFAALVAGLLSHRPGLTSSGTIQEAVGEVLKASCANLVERNGKPYGAAAMLGAILDACPELITDTEALFAIEKDFLVAKIAQVYVSPSYKQLARVLSVAENHAEVFNLAWTSCLKAVIGNDSDRRYAALLELLACRKQISDEELKALEPELIPVTLPRIEAAWTEYGEWDEILQLVSRSPIAAQLFGDKILAGISDGLLVPPRMMAALDGLRGFTKSAPKSVKNFLSTEAGKGLLPNLLLLSEAPEPHISKDANELIPVVQGMLGADISAGASGNAVVDVIQDGLNTAGMNSVSVDTLFNHARGLVKNNIIKDLKALIPDCDEWSTALRPFLNRPVDRSLAMTSPLAGAVYLIEPDTAQSSAVQRDPEGFSIPLRMAMYTIKLFSEMPDAMDVADARLSEVLAITLQLSNDHLSVHSASGLCANSDPELITEVSDSLADGQRILETWHDQLQEERAFAKLSVSAHDMPRSTELYYARLIESKAAFERGERDGASAADVAALEAILKSKRVEGDTFSILSQLYGSQLALSSSSYVTRYCNELVADLTMLQSDSLQTIGLPQLVIFDMMLTNYDDIAENIQKARLSRFTSKIVSWLEDESVDDSVVAEIYRILCHVLPLVSDMYGDHWRKVLDSIKDNLELVSELPDPNALALVPALHAALRLYAVLRRIRSGELGSAEDERNDDVLEAWLETEADITKALINALKVPRNVPDELHQPLLIFNELLSREMLRVPTSKLDTTEELFPQLYSPSPAVQQATYRLLHRYIPSKQEQISVDTVLDKATARLPDELLSLILETPSAADLHEEDFERSTPLQLRGYLLSWLLVFDHFTNASHKLKNDYAESMKEAGHLNDFLDFAFDFLGHAKGRPVDASKFDIASYNSSMMDESPLKDTQWLLTHLYYLCLTHFPALSKQWWMDCRSRQKSISVESWTSKFISPLVISAAMDAVVSWTGTQEKNHTSEEPPPLAIKANYRGSELTATYPMDEENSVSILVSLPPTFPLHNAKVHSATKSMAVEQKRWDAWLRNSQGIIAFSNNSIIDGLLAWRRNVFGTLKGQTECAICYSVVGEDGRVPSKRCRTCKNSFHGGCLYKWFKSSNGTSCPLCRESFNYA